MALGVSNKLLAIDWDRQDLRLVLVRPKTDGVDLLKAVSVPIPKDIGPDQADRFGAFVREAARQARISPKKALMAIPRDQVVLNTLNLPPTPADEMASIVQFQIVRELPFSLDQAALDYAVSGVHDPKAPCQVLVAAVRNEVIAHYKKVAAEAGLSVERIGLRPRSNVVAATAKSTDLDGRSYLLIEVGPHLTEIDIVREGALVFSRSASFALPRREPSDERIQDSRIVQEPLAEHEPSDQTREQIAGLMVEVIRSFEAYRATDSGIKIDRVIVCGATGLEAQLAEALAARFGVRSELYAPERALDLSAKRARELRGFSAALGLALDHGQAGVSSFDFLHPKKPISRRTKQLRKAPTAALAAIFLIAAGIAIRVKFINPLIVEEERLKAEINAQAKPKAAIVGLKDRVELVDDYLKSEQYWPEILAKLSTVFPPAEEAVVARLEFNTRQTGRTAKRTSGMKMRLRTTAMGKVHDISAKLRELGYENIRVGRETPIGGREVDIYRFDTTIDADLPPRPRRKPVPTDDVTEEEANGAELENEGESAVRREATESDKTNGNGDKPVRPVNGGGALNGVKEPSPTDDEGLSPTSGPAVARIPARGGESGEGEQHEARLTASRPEDGAGPAEEGESGGARPGAAGLRPTSGPSVEGSVPAGHEAESEHGEPRAALPAATSRPTLIRPSARATTQPSRMIPNGSERGNGASSGPAVKRSSGAGTAPGRNEASAEAGQAGRTTNAKSGKSGKGGGS